MADVQWIKLYTSFFDNQKIRMLRRRKDGDSVVLFYLFLLTIAGRCNACGEMFFTENTPYNPYILSQVFECTEEFVYHALNSLSMVEMVELSETSFRILDWEKHQNIEGLERIRENGRKRSQRFREKQKMLTETTTPEGSNVTVTLCNGAEENTEEIRKEQITEESVQCTTPVQEPVVVLTLPLIGGKEYPVYRKDIDCWQKAYPAINVDQELQNMKSKLIANPQKRRTEEFIVNSIINWLSIEQDKKINNRTVAAPRTFQPTEF